MSTEQYGLLVLMLTEKPLSTLDLLTHYSGLDGTGARGRFSDLSLRRKLEDYLAYFGPRRIRDGKLATWSNHGKETE